MLAHWVSLFPLLTTLAFAQTASDQKAAEHDKRVLRERVEIGKRHLDIGLWARDVGLVPQATTQFLRAVEASDGKHPGANTVLSVMRSYGDAFWRKEQKKPARALLADHARRVADADRRDRRSFAELGKSALGVGRVDEARSFLRQALLLGAEIAFDATGKAKLDGVPIPSELAAWLQGQTADVGDGVRVFEPAAKGGFTLKGFREHGSDALLVRSDLPPDRIKALHALGTALLPHVEQRLDGAPTRRLVLLVFAEHAAFTAYLQSLGVPAAGKGLAEYGSFQTIVSAEGLPDAELQGLVLHELSHLCFFGIAPAAMPDWYAEGFAESFGGQGTFTWDGKTLQLGSVMAKDRLDALRADVMPLAQFVTTSIEPLLAADRTAGLRFYTQAWAFQRFLRQPGSPWAKRFAHREAECRGAVLGAGGGRFGDTAPAAAKFQQLFEADFAEIDAKFRAWLTTL